METDIPKLQTKKLDWPGKLKWPETSARYFISKDWDNAIIKFLKEAALILKADYAPPETRSEDDKSTTRDDNGGYFWQGDFREGDETQNISVSYNGSQGEETVYALPLDERRTYSVKGLNPGQLLELICDYREYGAQISSVTLTLNVLATADEAKKIKKQFTKQFHE